MTDIMPGVIYEITLRSDLPKTRLMCADCQHQVCEATRGEATKVMDAHICEEP